MATEPKTDYIESREPPVGRPTSSRADRPAIIQAWHINRRLLAWSLAVVIVLVPALYGWYKFQVQRHAAAIFEHARSQYEKEDWNSAAAAFHRYLQLRPDDAEALLLRARAFDKLAVDPERLPRAASLFFQAIQANPERHDVRLRLAELLFDTRRYDEAAEQARKVSVALPGEVKAARLVAAAMREQTGAAKRVTVAEVVDVYQSALAGHKGDIPLSVGLAEMLRKKYDVLPARLRDTAIPTADVVMDRMVAEHAEDPEAYLARYRYRSAFQIGGAEEDLQQARQLAPDNIEVLLASALLTAATDHDAAREYGEKMLKVAPEDRRTYLTMSGIYARWNQPEDAIRTLQTGLKQIGENDIDLNRNLLQLYLFVGNTEGAHTLLGRIVPVARRIGPFLAAPIRSRLSEDIEVAQAQLQIVEGKTSLALPALKRMASSVTEGSDPAETLAERQRRWRMLAGAYSRLGLHDLAGTAYDELVRLDPTSQDYRLLAAAAWRMSGDIERAIRHFETATLGKSESPAAWIGLAEARIDYQLRKGTAETRDWRGVDATLKQVRARFGDAPGVVVLQATTAIARSNRRGAIDELKKLVDNKDLDPAILPRVAALLQDAGDMAGADGMLERYRESGGDPGVIAVTKSELLRRRGDAAAGIQAIEKALGQIPEAERRPLLRRLIGLEIDTGLIRSARRRLGELRKAKADDLWVYETAADLAILAEDHSDLQKCEDELKVLEGPAGSYWRYFRAVRLLESEKDGVEAVRMANPLLVAIQAIRPSWPLTRLLRGRIAERMGRIAEAADNYEIALRSGSRNLTAFQWLVATLYRQNRFADAAAYIRQVGQIATLAGDLSSQAIPANLKAGRIDDALRVARAAAELRPTDPLAQVWYGQTLALADKTADAESVLQKSIKQAPSDIRTWSALVWFYSRERRQAEARQTLADLIVKVEMTPLERQLVLARGSELIGDRQLAEERYLKALTDHQTDAKLLEEIGRFYFRFDHDKSLATFEKVLAINPKSTEARRAVAMLWGLRGSAADWGRAVAVLDEVNGSTPTDDRRLHAMLLLARGGAENTEKAVELISDIIAAEEPPRPTDRLLLARAYEDLKQRDEARAQIEAVLKDNDEPVFLVLAIEFYNRNNLLLDAREALARLEENDPANARALELRVDWLNRSNRSGEIAEVVERALAVRLAAAKNDEQKTALLRSAAELLTRVKLFAAAEEKLREVTALTPGGYEFLAIWLAQRQRVDEALALSLEKSSGDDVAHEAIVLVRVLTIAAGRSSTPPVESPAVQKAISAALESQKDKDSIQIMVELAVLRVMEGRDSEAIALSEAALAKAPANPVVLNNLAVLLADVPERAEEASGYIKKAVAAVPNSLELLDSKALVLMGAGRYADAREILDRLCHTSKKNARYRLHLAFALFHQDEPGQSREQIEQAMKDGLEQELLTPSERRLLQKITAQLANARPN